MGSDVLERIVKELMIGKKNMFLVKRLENLQLPYNIIHPAHTYVRKTFAYVLPHPRTLRRWYMVVDGKPGFTKEAFETIKNKVLDNKVYCNLTVDEMCVKRHIEIDTQQNMYGHINLGTDCNYDNGEIPIA